MSHKVYIEGYVIIEETTTIPEAMFQAQSLLIKHLPHSLVLRARTAERVCLYCLGEGEIATDEDDGEGNMMRGVGVEKCICQNV